MEIYQRIRDFNFDYRRPKSDHFIVFDTNDESNWLETRSDRNNDGEVKSIVINNVCYNCDESSKENIQFHLSFWEEIALNNSYDVLVATDSEFPLEILESNGFQKAENYLNPFLSSYFQHTYIKPISPFFNEFSSFFNNIFHQYQLFKKENPSFDFYLKEKTFYVYFYGLETNFHLSTENKMFYLKSKNIDIHFSFDNIDSYFSFFQTVKNTIYKRERIKSLTNPPKRYFQKFLNLYHLDKKLLDKMFDIFLSRFSSLEIENIFAQLFFDFQKEYNLNNNIISDRKMTFQVKNSPLVSVLTLPYFSFLFEINDHDNSIVYFDYCESECIEKLVSEAKEKMIFYLNESTEHFLSRN